LQLAIINLQFSKNRERTHMSFLRRTSLIASALLFATTLIAAEPQKRLMTIEDLWAVKRVGPPSLSPDGKWCAVEVTTFDMEKNDSTSDIWLLATDGKTQKRLTFNTPGEPEASATGGKASSPKWSPDGNWIAFLSKRGNDDGNQIYLISPSGGEAKRLTNMPFAPNGIKWGADSKSIFCFAWTWPDTPDDEGYRKKDKAEKDKKVKAYIIDDATYRYWDHWIADGKRPMVFAVDAATGKHQNLLTGVKLPNGNLACLPPYEPSDKDYDVSPDGKELCFVAENVKQIGMDQNTDLFTLELARRASEGSAKCITADNPGNDTNPVYSPDGKKIAFLRQTTKFFYADRTRAFRYERATTKQQELGTDVDRSMSNLHWHPKKDELFGEIEDSGRSRLGAISQELGLGWIQPFGNDFTDRAFDVCNFGYRVAFLRSTFDSPAAVFTSQYIEASKGLRPFRIDFFNDELVGQWRHGKTESVAFKGADDRDVQMWITYPPDFDPKKKWPLVQMVHGGPHNGVTTDFHFRWNAQLWAAQGWVVAQVNFHGSSGFGQAFTDSITGDYGSKPLTDILKATDWFEKQPWIDKERMAAAGASYGGYMMAYMNGHTDRFKAMVCHAGVYSYGGQMASDIVVSRRRALGGFPWEDYARNDKQSANRYAQNFKTPTLVIHGEKDFRVPVTHGLEYYNTLKMRGVPARLIYFPDENHWVLKPQNSVLWHKEVFAWIEKYIGKGPTRE
jgi:dipeptidyl aminopeptidase/acylaminoacyl peptidase